MVQLIDQYLYYQHYAIIKSWFYYRAIYICIPASDLFYSKIRG